MTDKKMDMAKKAIMQYVVTDNMVTRSSSIEELKKVVDEYHDSLYTVFYSPGDFTEEQIQCIKKDLPISDMRPEATIPQGQMIIIQNKYFNPLTDTSFNLTKSEEESVKPFREIIKKEDNVTASQIVASWCETEPGPIKDYLNNPRYVTAVCRCPVPFAMGIVIDKEKCISDDGWYHFHCTKCGLRGKVYG